MLIQCTIENFLSFKEKTTFSMVKGNQRKHNNHIIEPVGNDFVKALKAGIIYGANASGKSNFVKSLNFIQGLIVDGTSSDQIINRKPFALDSNSTKKPSEFTFNFCTNNKCYSYGISFDSKKILHEWLFEITKTSDKLLFERHSENNEQNFSFGKWIVELSAEDRQFIEFIAKGTRTNQPFLKESVDRQIDKFVSPLNWFKNSLQIIFPNTQLNIGRYLFENEDSFNDLISLLKDFGTGVVDFELKNIDINNFIPEKIRSDIENKLTVGDIVSIVEVGGKEKKFVRKNDLSNELEGLLLVLMHRGNDENNPPIQIDPKDESDGTIRLIDLIPILLQLKDDSKVFIVDEFDRSIHPNLSYKFLKLFLEEVKSNNQLIFTTHEENLLDLDLLRRDEIWFIEKDYYGASHMYSLEEFQPRYDKDIRKGYLQGRFGAIPVLRSPVFCKEEL